MFYIRSFVPESLVIIVTYNGDLDSQQDHFLDRGREFPRLSWWKVLGMHSLYIRLMYAILTSATNVYDGSR